MLKVKLTGLEDKIKSIFTDERLKRASFKAAEQMDIIKNDKTAKFESPAIGGIWVNTYHPDYAKRQKKGINRVNLRSNKPGLRSLINTQIINVGKGAEISFRQKSRKTTNGVVNMAEVLNAHHLGNAKGGKRRQIFPDNVAQLPREVLEVAKAELLR